MYKITKTGVKVFDNYKDNILIDKDNIIFNKLSSDKLNKICSENSEDAITWNIFKTLQNINDFNWLKLFANKINCEFTSYENINIKLWEKISPPQKYLKHKEGNSEIDLIIETNKDVIFCEAKYNSPISLNTKHNASRDQIIRNIEVGSFYSYNVNKYFYFILLLYKSSKNNDAIAMLNNYKNSYKEKLSTNYDNIKKIEYITCKDLIEVLKNIPKNNYSIDNLLNWLKNKNFD
ncbi:MAG: hypothetical protein GYA35_01580 [Thermoanaerobaculaceae bacterium]|nr:hypothetical protein [Thermoanaerobaculaceae bacterium]